jgi:hypothetical protein
VPLWLKVLVAPLAAGYLLYAGVVWCATEGVVLACAFTFCAGLGASAMSIAVGVAVRAVPAESAGAASGLVVSSMACSGMVIQAAAMATTAIPGTTPVGRSQACAAGVIVVVLGALWVARNVTDAPAPGSSR